MNWIKSALKAILLIRMEKADLLLNALLGILYGKNTKIQSLTK